MERALGRRSVPGLRWDDVDLETRTIRWRPALDKRRKTWVTPIPTRALDALLAHRAAYPPIGPTLLFPHPRDRNEPVTRHLAGYWLKRAYALARIAQPRRSPWHVFRRVWATERKYLPPKDVAAAGGWSDIGTLIGTYQQVDTETLRQVVDYVPPSLRRPRRSGIAASHYQGSGEAR